jgi:hypothetical protein
MEKYFRYFWIILTTVGLVYLAFTSYYAGNREASFAWFIAFGNHIACLCWEAEDRLRKSREKEISSNK